MNTLLPILFLVFLLSCSDDRQLDEHSPSGKPVREQIDSLEFVTPYHFASFPTADAPMDKLAEPVFPADAEKEYKEFIKDKCKQQGINFAGHYTAITRSCGAECVHLYLVDRISGQLFSCNFSDSSNYGFAYKKDSRMLIANANLFLDDNYRYYFKYWYKPELYEWEDDHFKKLN
jgi:hypothetical protein